MTHFNYACIEGTLTIDPYRWNDIIIFNIDCNGIIIRIFTEGELGEKSMAHLKLGCLVMVSGKLSDQGAITAAEINFREPEK
jgi:hypothetical protein